MLTKIPGGLFDELRRDFGLREEYSGRGMNGSTCVGMVGDEGDLIRFVSRLTSLAEDYELDGYELATELADRLAVDSMGRGATIYYFPGVTIGDPDEDED